MLLDLLANRDLTFKSPTTRRWAAEDLGATPPLEKGWWRLDVVGGAAVRVELWHIESGAWVEVTAAPSMPALAHLPAGRFEVTLRQEAAFLSGLTLTRLSGRQKLVEILLPRLAHVARRLARGEIGRLVRSARAIASRTPLSRTLGPGPSTSEASAEMFTPVRVPPPPPPETWPAVTVIVPTRDAADLIDLCLEGLFDHTDYPDLDVILIDNDSSDPRALDTIARWAKRERVNVIRVEEPFNFSRLCNLGVEAAASELIVLLNNDVTPNEPLWLQSLVRHAVRPEVGIVGPLLTYPDGGVQQAGVALGLRGLSGHPWRGATPDDRRLNPFLHGAQMRSALTGACMVMRRATYLAAGGMDEVLFPVTLNDIDLCLKATDLGLEIVFEPAAQLTHHESRTRPNDARPDQRQRRLAEMNAFRQRWRDRLDDPYYSPNLRVDDESGAPRSR